MIFVKKIKKIVELQGKQVKKASVGRQKGRGWK
jgi:hypothetical protein